MAYPLTKYANANFSITNYLYNTGYIHFLQLCMTGGVKHVIVSTLFVISGRLCNIIDKTRFEQIITYIIKLITITFYLVYSLVKPKVIRVVVGYRAIVKFTCQSYNMVEWFRLDSDQFLLKGKSMIINTTSLTSHRSYYCKTKNYDGFTVYGYANLKVYSK